MRIFFSLSSLTREILADSRIDKLRDMALVGSSAASCTSSLAASSGWRSEPGTRPRWLPSTHWAAVKPSTFSLSLIVCVVMDAAHCTSSSPSIWFSWTMRIHKCLKTPPRRSAFPSCQGASRGIDWSSTPNCVTVSAKIVIHSLPRSTTMTCGIPAQLDQTRLKNFSMSLGFGMPRALAKGNWTPKLVPSSTMLIKKNGTPLESLAVNVSIQRRKLKMYLPGTRAGRAITR